MGALRRDKHSGRAHTSGAAMRLPVAEFDASGVHAHADTYLWLASVPPPAMSTIPLETLETLEILDEFVEKALLAEEDWEEVARRGKVIADGLRTGACSPSRRLVGPGH